MTLESWLNSASEDARRRGLDGLPALLETLARSRQALRAADAELRRRSTPDPERRPEDA